MTIEESEKLISWRDTIKSCMKYGDGEKLAKAINQKPQYVRLLFCDGAKARPNWIKFFSYEIASKILSGCTEYYKVGIDEAIKYHQEQLQKLNSLKQCKQS